MTSAGRTMPFRRAAAGLVLGAVGGLFGHLVDPPGTFLTALLGGAAGLLLGVTLAGLWKPRATPSVPPHGLRCERCPAAATLHITEAGGREALGEVHLCEEDSRRYLGVAPAPPTGARWQAPPAKPSEGILAAPAVTGLSATPPSGPGPASREVEVDVIRVVISETYDQQLLLLREVSGGGTFPLVCGIFEATAIDRRLKGLHSPRPLTHDGWASTVAALGGRLRDVCIHELRETTYLAQLRVVQGDRLVRVDARPSDAITLALVCGVPILVANELLG
jgi:bifunctional DNase/RNase